MKYVDLFSGCGGLSLGIERAGGELLLAVEKSDMAARTFHHNLIGDAADLPTWELHIGADIGEQVKRRMVVKELSAFLAEDELVEQLSAQDLDLIVGGPPCQGFSLAGRRNPSDIRNRLAWEYLELVERAQPKAVVIENVVGMSQKFSTQESSSFDQLQQALAETEPGYVVQGVLVNAMHYGAPQHRPRLMIIGLRKDIARLAGVKSTGTLWKSHFADEQKADIPDLAPIPTIQGKNVRTIGEAISDLATDSDPAPSRKTAYQRDMQSFDWRLAVRKTNGVPLNHVFRKHAVRTVQRFRFYQYLALSGLDQRLLGRAANLEPEDARLFMKLKLTDAPLPAVSPDKTILAESLEQLCDLAMGLLTKKHSQKVLAWDKPARTVVTLPDDYVHPLEPRIFTVRELARFQGFPDDFEFLGKETTGAQRRRVEVPQYSQVGNAVSPWLSYAVGLRLATVLKASGSN